MSIETTQPQQQTMKRRALLFPLYLKVLVVLLCALVPLVVLAFVSAGSWALSPASLQFLRQGALPIGPFMIRVLYLMVGAAVALGLGLGLSLADILLIHPARRLLHWMYALRKAEFKVVPPLPHRGHDEIGEIGAQIGIAALKFAESKEQVQDSTEERSLFIMTAAHQLRTPLTALSWTIDALQNPATPAEERAQLLSSMGESFARMHLVIEHILASAHVEQGRFGFVFESIDIVPIIEKLIKEFKPVSEKEGVSLVFEHAGTFAIYADKERIALAISDLISNALQYTPKGGSVVVAVAAQGGKLEVSVKDTGIGISEDERAHLFGKFYRSERARHMRPDGSGLGLFLVKNIIEKHGSDVTVESVEGQGTRISFFLSSDKSVLR